MPTPWHNKAAARGGVGFAIVRSMHDPVSPGQDTDRRVGDVIRMGVVDAVDLGARRCTVKIDDDYVTGNVPWLVRRAGKTRSASAPSVGEQGLFLCPDGDLEQGVFMPGVYSDAFDAPTDDDVEHLQCDDGAVFAYDPVTHQLTVTLPAGGKAAITAPAGVDLQGDLRVDGKVTATDDVTAVGVSLKDHVHLGVQAGAAKSGKPEAGA